MKMKRVIGQMLVACAECGSEFTHQRSVDTFFRDCEDSEDGLHVVVTGNSEPNGQAPRSSTARSMRGNPSQRRDGVRVVVYCEHCDMLTHVDIVQHKGQTLLFAYADFPAENKTPKLTLVK